MTHRIPTRANLAASPPFTEALQLKLSRILSSHQQLKIAFHRLNSQVAASLLEAEDVFASLAVPLTKLVGLKTVEMAAEGRFNSVLTANDRSNSQDEHYLSRAMVASNDLKERQKQQLIRLIDLLRKIETQVNSSQKSIFQSLADHQASIQNFFLKALTYASSIHQSNQKNDLSLVMLKLLKVASDLVIGALGSVEVQVDDLIHELATHMCNPMVEYVNVLKVEMKYGTCSHLLEVVKEMDSVMIARKFELEEARKTVRLAELSRVEALSKLREMEETTQKMTLYPGLLINAKEGPENVTQQEATDDTLIWELLRKKRKCLPNSSRVTAHSQWKEINPMLAVNPRMVLGSSPPSSTRKVLSRKRVTP
ncbi:uncharacterized protein [Primulina eburnea]|uniref:uncharacterized protein n=1 Tax=Primulina eburnea TaxID=1245227 RepID=UPI003C6C392D